MQEQQAKIGLFLVASPSLGSRYADWLKPFTTLIGHSQAQGLATGDEQLRDIHNRFINLKEKQQLPIKGKELIEAKFKAYLSFWIKPLVVPFSAAIYFEDSEKIEKSDHSSITKPPNRNAKQHQLLCHFIQNKFRSPPQTNLSQTANPVATAQ